MRRLCFFISDKAIKDESSSKDQFEGRITLPDLPADRIPTLQLAVIDSTEQTVCKYIVNDVRTRSVTRTRECNWVFKSWFSSTVLFYCI